MRQDSKRNLFMNKILFLLDSFYPKPSPNSICVNAIIHELIKYNYQVHIIVFKKKNERNEEILDEIKIHRINMNLYYIFRGYGEENRNYFGKICIFISKIIFRINKLLFLPWFPLASPLLVSNYYIKAIQVINKYKINHFISIFNPVETIYASNLIKKTLPKVRYGAYILDSLLFLSGQDFLPLPLRRLLAWKFEKSVYENADTVFNMICYLKHHKNKKYQKYAEKMIFLDTPLFSPKKINRNVKSFFNTKKVHLVYMGSLYKGYRSPNYLIQLFQKINTMNKYQLHFFSRGSCEDVIKSFEKKTNESIKGHGMVSIYIVHNIMNSSNFLINFGVSNSSAISSKIFDYMSTGKPIIHLYYNEEDTCLSYLKKYPLSLLIKIDINLFEDNKNKLELFLKENQDKHINSDELLDIFYYNTPYYTAKVFKQFLNNENARSNYV